MKYFAKYLPVEGEIKRDDWYIWKDNKQVAICLGDEEVLAEHLKHGDVKKVKLFLCTRDIKVGDNILVLSSTGKTYPEIPLNQLAVEATKKSTKKFKVIGEISPEAKWVKEGDEFEENQIEFWHQAGTGYGFVIKPKIRPDWLDLVHSAKILGPCGHFH